MFAIRPWLYIAGFRDITNPELLAAHQISAILELDAAIHHTGISTLYLPITDGEWIAPASFAQGTEFVRQQKANGGRVVIACGAGQSRSVTFVVAVLKELEQQPLIDIYVGIWQAYPRASIHPQLWMSLCSYYHDATPFTEVVRLTQRQ